MKIAVLGAGAIGGWLAAGLLQQGQADVSLLARGATLQALREHGPSPWHRRSFAPVRESVR